VKKVVFGGMLVFVLIYEENLIGGSWVCCFLGFWAVVHVALLRRGSLLVFCVG
jgi:hypothetical protein